MAIDREEGFRGYVAVNVEGLPAGVTALAAMENPAEKPPLPNGGRLERYTPKEQRTTVMLMRGSGCSCLGPAGTHPRGCPCGQPGRAGRSGGGKGNSAHCPAGENDMSARLILLLAAASALAAETPAVPIRPRYRRHTHRKGCNNVTCHGGVKGRGGLKLSPAALSPKDDYEWIVKGGAYQVLTAEIAGERKPRIDLHDPERSLLLLKPTTRFRMEAGDGLHRILPNTARSWRGSKPARRSESEPSANDRSPAWK